MPRQPFSLLKQIVRLVENFADIKKYVPVDIVNR